MGTNKYDDVRELLNRVHTFLSDLCRNARCDEHCSECIEASDLADDVYDLLNGPRRNCDVGTDEEQAKRFEEFCNSHTCTMDDCKVRKSWHHFFHDCGLERVSCGLIFAQMPYEAEEGGKE